MATEGIVNTMIKSMTGYGRGEAESNGQRFVVETKAVNHRYSDIYVRMPKQFHYLEDKIKTEVKKYISRGKVDVYLTSSSGSQSGRSVEVDYRLAEELINALLNLKAKYKLSGDITLDNMLSYPEIFIIKEDEEDPDAIWLTVNTALHQALNELAEMRAKEGAALAEDLKSKTEHILNEIDNIAQFSEEMIANYRQQLHTHIESLLNGISVEPERLEAEVIIYADKCSIDEEIVRIKSHIKQFRNNLETDEPVGRKLDFLLQEINREINTIGSKSNNVNIATGVVEVKTQLEKIREQVQNIE
jgi:uncharacterized protein (TIGR00255 family)